MDPNNRLPSPPILPPPPVASTSPPSSPLMPSSNAAAAARQTPPPTAGSAGTGTRSRSGSGRMRSNSLRRASASFMSAPLGGLWTTTGDILLTPSDENNIHATMTRTTTGGTILEETPSGEKRSATAPPAMIGERSVELERLVENGRTVTPEQERLIQEWRAHFDREDAKKGNTWWQKTVWGLLQFWKFFKTLKGFFITVWLLLVIAWGGMIFLLLCNASPAMISKYGPNDVRSARKKWLEVDTQVLNALFCVTGFGLFPWRARDAYLLYLWRVKKDVKGGYEVLAGIHRGWFRADDLGPRLPLKLKEAVKEQHKKHEEAAGDEEDGTFPAARPDVADEILNVDEGLGEKTTDTSDFRYATRTGNSATGTKPVWLLDAVVWFNLWNSLWQACLAGCVWGMNRIERPTWTTTVFIILSFGCGLAAGFIIWKEGSRIGKAEGKTVPVPLRVTPEDSQQ